jgi:hypothetical protein
MGKLILDLTASTIFHLINIIFSPEFISVANIFSGIFTSSIFVSQNIFSKSLYILFHETTHFFKSKSINFKKLIDFTILFISSDFFPRAKQAQIIAHILVQAISFI